MAGIRVFLSYREARDEDAAEELKKALIELSAGRVDVTLMADFSHGQNFKTEIWQAAPSAHWFILVLSDVDASEWCMFETGMFAGSMVSGKINRLVCNTPPQTAPPDPIQEFLAVSATPPSSFLIMTA